MFSAVFNRSLPRGGRGYLPVDNRSPRDTDCNIPRLVRHGVPTFLSVGLAALAGTLLGFSLLSFISRPDYGHYQPSQALPDDIASLPNTSPYIQPPLRPSDLEHLSVEALEDIVAQTKGYWVRDWSLHLGWNNMRYIIETALLHGSLLNRTVVIPSFVYARSCEYQPAVCGDYVTTVNHGDAVGSDEWRKLPPDEQLSWRVPIGVMLNMTLLRSTQPVITVSEYLRLHNLPEDAEASNGHWDRTGYHRNPNKYGKAPSLYVIQNGWYDPSAITRVDFITDEMKSRGGWISEGSEGKGTWPKNAVETAANRALTSAMSDNGARVLEWDRARQILQEQGYGSEANTDTKMEVILNKNGWEVLHTYQGARGMEYVKNVVNPERDVAPRESLRGIRDDYGHIHADVVLLEGEIHYTRKPASLRFTTTKSRDAFSRLVLHRMRALDRVYALADELAARMQAMNGGRMWLSAHMRRGDFVRTNWAMEPTVEAHLTRIKNGFAQGRNTLRSFRGQVLGTYSIPDVVADQSIARLPPPEDNDKFYLATDERDPGNVNYLIDHGAVLVSHLLTHKDRQDFGWSLILTDVLGQVEQAVLAKSTFFYAQSLSSYAGGTVNMRAVAGLDPRTAMID